MFKYIVFFSIMLLMVSLISPIYSEEIDVEDKVSVTVPEGYTFQKEGRFSSVDYFIYADNGQPLLSMIFNASMPDLSTFESYADTFYRSQTMEYTPFEKGCNDEYLSTSANYCYVIYLGKKNYDSPELYMLEVWYEIDTKEAILFSAGALTGENLEDIEPIVKEVITSTTPLIAQ